MNAFGYLVVAMVLGFALLVTYAVVRSWRQSRSDAAHEAESRHNVAAHAADGYPPSHQPGHGWQQQA
jgi:hypothetical protein